MIRKKQAKKQRKNRNRILIINPRFSRYKEALKATTLKFDNIEDFIECYLNAGARGIYWIGTDNPDLIDSEQLEKELTKQKGKITAYISPAYIQEPFAAEINAARLDPERDFKRNLKDPKHSIHITKPQEVYVNYIYPREKAWQVWLYNSRYLPSSYKQLKEHWDWVQANPEVVVKPIHHTKKKKT